MTRAGAVLAVAAASAAVSARALASALPDGRAFERVSQQNTDGTPALEGVDGLQSMLSPAGDDAVLFGGALTPPTAAPSGRSPVYLAQRTATGWSDSAFSPSSGPGDEGWNLVDATPSLSGAIFDSTASAGFETPPADQPPNELLYRGGTGEFTPIVIDAPYTDTSDPSSYDSSEYGGMSADGQTVVYSSDVTPPGLPDANGLRYVYAWSPGGSAVRLPSGDEDTGSPLPSDCGSEVGGLTDSSILSSYGLGLVSTYPTNPVSSDGSTIFVQSGEGGAGCPAPQLYAVHSGVATLISQVTETGAGAPAQPPPSSEGAAQFVGATPDGSVAYFVTSNHLDAAQSPSDTGNNLYEWTAPAGGAPASVRCLSCEASSSADVSAVQVSPSGQYVYFVANGDIDGEGGSSASVFVAHAGLVQVVGPPNDGTATPGEPQALTSFTTNAMGNVAVYSDVTEADGLYRAVVTSAGVQTTCLSCLADGTEAPALTSSLATAQGGSRLSSASTLLGPSEPSIMSADGSEVVFESSAALSPGAVSGTPQAYRWLAGSGTALIAPDAPTAPEISPDGSNILVQSGAALTADTTQVDTGTLYDARVGGGFAAPGDEPPSCSGSGCRAASSSSPGAPIVGSERTTSGNVHGRDRAPSLSAIPRPTPKALARFLAGGELAFRIRATGSGRVRAELLIDVGRHRLVLASAAARTRATEATVTLRLHADRSALRSLRRRGRTRATLMVSLLGARTREIQVSLDGRIGR